MVGILYYTDCIYSPHPQHTLYVHDSPSRTSYFGKMGENDSVERKRNSSKVQTSFSAPVSKPPLPPFIGAYSQNFETLDENLDTLACKRAKSAESPLGAELVYGGRLSCAGGCAAAAGGGW